MILKRETEKKIHFLAPKNTCLSLTQLRLSAKEQNSLSMETERLWKK